MQWNDEEFAGFSTHKPWINVNPNYKEINVKKALEDKDSIFYYYKELINIRKNNKIIVYGDYKEIKFDNEYVYGYERNYEDKQLIVINNFSKNNAKINLNYNIKNIMLSNYKENKINGSEIELRAYESIIFFSK